MRILFIDDRPCSSQNGIGTFRDILTLSLSGYTNIYFVLVSLNSNVNEVIDMPHDRYREIQIPPYDGGKWRSSGSTIAEALRKIIPDAPDNIFIFNYSPCAEFIAHIKKAYPLSKTVFIVHDQGWCAPLLGDAKLLSKIIQGQYPSIVSDSTASFVKDYCTKEISIYSLVDKVACLSDSTYQVLTNIYKIPHNKVVKIENGIVCHSQRNTSKSRSRHQLGIPNSEKVLIFVARPVRHKGIDVLLMALKQLNRKYPGVRCVIAGDVCKIAKHWNLAKDCAANIILPGFLPQTELRKWYAASDLGIISSYTEQCSFAALEMMNAGLPIVSSNGIGLNDMFIDQVNSFVAEIGNVTKVKSYAKRFAAKITEALQSPTELQNQYITHNRGLLRTKYSAPSMAQKYLELFQDLSNIT